MHPKAEFVCHNVAFDFWVLYKEFERVYNSNSCPEQFLLDMVDRGQFHDTMLMDQLIALAEGRANSHQRDLGLVTSEYAPEYSVDKKDPFRTRYAEILGREDEWQSLEKGWFEYAAKDALATWHVWESQHDIANKLVGRSGLDRCINPIDPECRGIVECFGILTEQIQVRAAISLARSTHLGFGVDKSLVAEIDKKLRDSIEEQVIWLRQTYPQLLKFKGGAGTSCVVQRVKGSVVPALTLTSLRFVLDDIATERGVRPPTTPTGQITTALDEWRQIAPGNEFVSRWSKMMDSSKTLQFINKLQKMPQERTLFQQEQPASILESIHPTYTTLVKTGRTSSSDPNTQNWPRDGWFRQIFTARNGYTLVVADYSAIELVTLAAVLKRRFGWSKLYEVLVEGRDPHAYTASLVLGRDPSEWDSFDKSFHKEAKKARQGAKAINFGVPGGLGKDRLAEYAKSNYGVEMSVEEASRLRQLLIADVYPELSLYLAEDSFRVLSHNLGCTKGEIWDLLNQHERPSWMPIVVRKIVSGNLWKKDGTVYNPELVRTVWSVIANLVKKSSLSEKWKELVQSHTGSPLLEARLFRERAITLTGRIRDNILYTEARNTPFQGLAADGGKLALWRLTYAGIRVVAFVHDEIVCEVREADARLLEKQIVQTMQNSMVEVIQCGLPVKVASTITKCWEKP